MDDLLQTALLGTAKQPPAPPADHPADALTTRLTAETPERHLLLRAGVRAVYHTAGQPLEPSEAPTPTSADPRPVCSRRVAEILAKLLTFEPRELLVEAVGRLDRAGQRLPPELLPRALSERDAKIRPALRPVLGERGRWLCPFNEAWQWAIDPLAGTEAEATGLPANAEEIWKEGTFTARLAILERVGQVDPERAQRWVQETWSAEKAEHREEILDKLARTAGVPQEFLEQALNDRSGKVRSTAALVLAHLSGSPLAERMRARAESLLTYTPPKAPRGLGAALRTLVGSKPSVGIFTVTLPKQLVEEWKRDGIDEKVPQGFKANPRAWWLCQVITLIPPSHWESVFHASPEELIAAAEVCEESLMLLQAWTHATLNFAEPGWSSALWDFWYRHEPPRNPDFVIRSLEKCLTDLLHIMAPAALEPRVLRVLQEARPVEKNVRSPILEALPAPWSVTIARQYLAGLRAHFADVVQDPRAAQANWYMTLVGAAVALPEECFAEALEDLGFPPQEENTARAGRNHQNQWRAVVETTLDQFREILLIRKEFIEQLIHDPVEPVRWDRRPAGRDRTGGTPVPPKIGPTEDRTPSI